MRLAFLNSAPSYTSCQRERGASVMCILLTNSKKGLRLAAMPGDTNTVRGVWSAALNLIAAPPSNDEGVTKRQPLSANTHLYLAGSRSTSNDLATITSADKMDRCSTSPHFWMYSLSSSLIAAVQKAPLPRNRSANSLESAASTSRWLSPPRSFALPLFSDLLVTLLVQSVAHRSGGFMPK